MASKTCLDNILHDMKGCKGDVIELALSDHSAELLKCPVRKTCMMNFWYQERRDYSAGNRHKFINCIRSLSFSEVFELDDPNKAFNAFYDMFKLFYNL